MLLPERDREVKLKTRKTWCILHNRDNTNLTTRPAKNTRHFALTYDCDRPVETRNNVMSAPVKTPFWRACWSVWPSLKIQMSAICKSTGESPTQTSEELPAQLPEKLHRDPSDRRELINLKTSSEISSPIGLNKELTIKPQQTHSHHFLYHVIYFWLCTPVSIKRGQRK